MDNNFYLEWNKAQTSLINGLYDQAIVHYTNLITQHPKNYDLLIQRAVAFIALNNLDSAVKDCDLAIGLDSARPEGFWRRGMKLLIFLEKKIDLKKKENCELTKKTIFSKKNYL